MKSTGRNNSQLELLVLLMAALVMFTQQLGKRDIVTSHEGRVAQTARIMASNGWPWSTTPVRVRGYVESNEARAQVPHQLPDNRGEVNPWLFPVINNQIRLQKPPLPYWITAALFRAFAISPLYARLAPAVLGALATLLIWDLSRKVLGRRSALPTALVWMTTRFIVDETRKSMADPYLEFFVLLAVWSWMRGGIARHLAWIVLMWIALALGVLAKGPVIFLFVVPAVILAKLLLKRRGERWLGHAIGVIVFIAIALPWPLLVLHHAPEAWRIWWYESGGEVSGLNVEKARGWWTYALDSFPIALPWTAVWIAGIVLTVLRLSRRGLRAPRNRRRVFALAWYLLLLIFFSFVGVKKDAYLLPVMPAQALIVAESLTMMRASLARKMSGAREMSIVLMCMQVAIALGFAGGIMFASRHLDIAIMTDVLCAGAILFAIAAIVKIAGGLWRGWLIAQSTSYALLLIAFIGGYLTAQDNNRSPRNFELALIAYLNTTEVPLHVKSLPEEVAFHLPLNLPDAGDASHVLVVIDHSPKDPPVDVKTLSELFDGAPIEHYERVLVAPAQNRYQLFDVTINRNRA